MLTQIRKFKRDVGRVRREGPPKIMYWAVINHCNAVCKTCTFYLVPKKERTEVSFDDGKRAIEVMARSNFRLISMTGGEPLMHTRFFDLAMEVNRAGMEITYIPTNGILVDDAMARELARVKAKVVGISVEKTEADGMGLTRKIKNFRRVMEGAREHLDRHAVPNYAGVVLTTGTNDVFSTLRYVKELGFRQVAFSYPQLEQNSSYVAASKIEELDLTTEMVLSQVEQLKRAKREMPELKIFNSDESLDDFARFYTGEKRRFPCYGGNRLFYMDWKCDVFPCFTLGTRYANLLEVDEFVVQDPATCDKCSQQGFREMGPVFAGVSAVSSALGSLGEGRPLSAAKTLLEPESRAAMSSMMELYRGGFV